MGEVVANSIGLDVLLQLHLASMERELHLGFLQKTSEQGPNSEDNGVFMRSDMHALFGAGYLIIDYDRAGESRVVVSSRLHQDFGNGKDRAHP